MNALIITNGDSTLALMQDAGFTETLVPWRDVLHEGPVPAGLDLRALSRVRARYLADRGAGDVDQLMQDFDARDEVLRSLTESTSVTLWLEHDLYDQLQLLQLLDWFADHPHPQLSLVCTNHYLGLCTPDQITKLASTASEVLMEHCLLGRAGWQAFRSADPNALLDFLEEDLSPLPFMEEAILRLLEEYPAPQSGLSRTASQILQKLTEAPHTAPQLFQHNQACEERVFMGDWSFWSVLASLMHAAPPLIEACDTRSKLAFPPHATPQDWHQQTLQLTPAGSAVLEGKINFLDCAPQPWTLGGVHFEAGHYWVWDADQHALYLHKTDTLVPKPDT